MTDTTTVTWLSIEAVCDHLGVARSTYNTWRAKRCAPPAKRLPNGRVITRSDWLDSWLDELPEVA